MEDFPLDYDLYSLPVSASPSAESDLGALNGTINPSSSSDLLCSLSLGEIPVFLYDDAYIETLSSQDLDTIEEEGLRRDKRDSVLLTLSHKSSVAVNMSSNAKSQEHLSTAQSETKASNYARCGLSETSMSSFGTSDSSDTIGSFGTFGPKRRTIEMDSKDFSAFLETQALAAEASYSTRSVIERRSIDFHPKKILPSASALSLSDVFSSPGILGAPKGDRSSRALEKDDAVPVFRILDQERLQSRKPSPPPVQDENFSTTSSDPEMDTPKARLSTTASWISSKEWAYPQYKENTSKETLHSVPHVQRAAPYVKYVEFDSISPIRRKIQVQPSNIHNRDLNVEMVAPYVSSPTQEITENNKQKEKRSEQHHHHHVHRTPPKDNIEWQEKYDWLKGTTIQFLIDQEGFRAAQPFFRFTGVARVRPPQGSKLGDASLIMAQFRPIARQSFHFHYAPFETCPNLRRLTVDFDENYDYFSRQALLPLKFNGVYVLHGYEISHSSHASVSAETLKLHWQFEYLVDDRRMDGSNRVMEGEKDLTPLSFSCSPEFVLPTQGKKNTIMQVFKKSMAPKLVAEKLQPPGTSRVTTNKPENISPSKKTDALLSHLASCKANYLSSHKRGQSHSIQQSSHHKSGHGRSPLGVDKENDYNHVERQLESVRRRRASSAGERHHSPEIPHFKGMPPPQEGAVQNATVFRTPPRRHIIPPAKLIEMMEMDTPPSSKEITPTQTIPEGQATGLIPLTPRPRNIARAHTRNLSRSR